MKRADAPLARALIESSLRITKLTKMRSIYDGIAPASDGAVHSFQNPAGTETTRFSHSSTWLFDPGSYNLATLPKKTALGDSLFKVRDCVVPHYGRVLVAADYSRAEARWCAYIAGDEERIRMQSSDVDEYRIFAALTMWDDETRWQEVEKKHRDSFGKVGVLSGQYKVKWPTLQSSVNDDFELHGVTIDAKTAKRMEGIWIERFPRTVSWWAEVADQVLTHRFTINPLGRRRYYFGRDDTESARQAIVREAIADGPQSANAMALNMALKTLYRRHDPWCPEKEQELGEKFLWLHLNVHDEGLFSCLPKDLMRVARVIKAVMERPFDVNGRTLVIPAEVKATTENWSSMREVHV